MLIPFGHGEVRVYRGTGVSRGVRRTTWERSLEIWELQISCFEEFLGGENVLGLVPVSLPHTLGYACTFYAPTSPPPTHRTLSLSVISVGYAEHGQHDWHRWRLGIIRAALSVRILDVLGGYGLFKFSSSQMWASMNS